MTYGMDGWCKEPKEGESGSNCIKAGQNGEVRPTNDCISRQAAIDVLDLAIDLWKGQLGEGILIAVKENMAKLLSAQPEIIRCGECKYAEVADIEDEQDGYTCQFHRGSIWFSGSYCSWAERREVSE